MQEVVLHDVRKNHLEEPPLRLLAIEGDGTLQALPHDAVHEGVNYGGLARAICPSTMKISPSITSPEMEFNSVLILGITSDSLRLTVGSIKRSFLHKSDCFRCFFTLYERFGKMMMKGTESEGQVITNKKVSYQISVEKISRCLS